MPNYNADFFYTNAKQRLRDSGNLFSTQLGTLASPYYSFGYHGSSVFYPFANLLKGAFNLGRGCLGALFLLEALANDPLRAIPQVIGGIVLEACSLVVNVLNAAVAFISFFTRTFATICNLGYTSFNLWMGLNSFNGREIGGRNQETTMNMLNVFALQGANIAAEAVEANLYQQQFNF